MPSPFPGMDPYLEQRELWPSVHARLIAAIDEALGPQLPPPYYSSIEERFYIANDAEPREAVADVLVARRPAGANGVNGADGAQEAVPAMEQAAGRATGVLVVELPSPGEVKQGYIEIRTAGNHELVTVIEVLSPTNKLPGEGRRQYEAKRQATLDSFANLVEVDLLRAGEPLPMRSGGAPVPSGAAGYYRVLVSRATERPQGTLLVSDVTERLPAVPVPLRPPEIEPIVDLQSLVEHVYALGRYERRIDYRASPVPGLPASFADWADQLLRNTGRR